MSENLQQPFTGRVALVTGGANGIGSVIARKFATYGADVVVVDQQIDEKSYVLQDIRKTGRKAWGFQLDISQVEQIRCGIIEIVKEVGRVDILVNNAGIYPACSIMEENEAHFDRVVAVNMKGLFFMTQTVLKESMLANQYGRIVNITSIDAKNPPAGQAVYSATKGAVICFTKSFAMELAGTNINCNAVAPGWIETKGLLANDRWKTYLPLIPARRLGTQSEIAEAVCFLCNDKVSYINGEILDVNGGMLMD